MEKIKRYVPDTVAAKIIGCSPQTLRNNRSKGRGLPYIKFSRSVRYDVEDIEKFMAERKITPSN